MPNTPADESTPGYQAPALSHHRFQRSAAISPCATSFWRRLRQQPTHPHTPSGPTDARRSSPVLTASRQASLPPTGGPPLQHRMVARPRRRGMAQTVSYTSSDSLNNPPGRGAVMPSSRLGRARQGTQSRSSRGGSVSRLRVAIINAACNAGLVTCRSPHDIRGFAETPFNEPAIELAEASPRLPSGRFGMSCGTRRQRPTRGEPPCLPVSFLSRRFSRLPLLAAACGGGDDAAEESEGLPAETPAVSEVATSGHRRPGRARLPVSDPSAEQPEQGRSPTLMLSRPMNPSRNRSHRRRRRKCGSVIRFGWCVRHSGAHGGRLC